MERGSFFGTGDVVVDCDGNCVAPIGFDCWSRKLAVDEEYLFLVAVWRYCTSRDCEIIGSLLT